LGRHLRADMALLEGSLCGDEFKCEGIFEIKTNFTAQSFNIIKKRLADDWSKWNEWTNANKKLCLIYIVTEIKHDESSNNFPKYKQKPTKIEKIEDYFIRFSEENGGHYNKINKFNASSSYPGCGVFNITTNFLVIEN
jgi:hypothetical protein